MTVLLQLARGEIVDVKKCLSSYFDSKELQILSGKGEIAGQFSNVQQDDTGPSESSSKDHLRFSFPKLEGRWREASFTGSLVGNLDLNGMKFNASQIQVPSGNWVLYDVDWKFPKHHEQNENGWWMIGEFSSFSTHRGPKQKTSGQIQLNFKSTLPLLGLFQQIGNLSRMQRQYLTMTEPKITAEILALGSEIDLKSVELMSSSLKAKGQLSFLESGAWGQLRLSYGMLSAGLRLAGKKTEFSLLRKP
jgi:hypothetical protein